MAERQLAITMLAAGAKKVDVPTIEQARLDFDAFLCSVPTVKERDERLLLEALGVAS